MASSFSASLSIPGFTTDLTYVRLSMQQATDSLGRPASVTQGGTLTVEFNSTDDKEVNEWMASPTMRLDGTVTYLQLVPKVPLRIISFVNAYCIDFHEHFDSSGGSGQMRTTIIISPEKLVASNIELDNRWPETE